MEYCEHGDLSKFLFLTYPQENDGKEYPWTEKIRMMKEICLSMEYLHSRNIIHRDLKLDNVLVDVNENCKLMDFGLSKLVDRMSQKKTQRIGTSIFIAPEVILHSKYNEMCDVFSFSIMIFIIATGNRYQYGEDENCVELRVAQDPLYRPSIHELSKLDDLKSEGIWMKNIVQLCWDHDPNKRLAFKDIARFLIKYHATLKNEDVKDLEIDEELERKLMKKVTGKSLGKNSLGHSAATSEKKELLKYIQSLLVETEELKRKVNELEEENARNGGLKKENLELKKKLGLAGEEN